MDKLNRMMGEGKFPAPVSDYRVEAIQYNPRFVGPNGSRGPVLAVEQVPSGPNSGTIIAFAPAAETLEHAVRCLAHELFRFHPTQGENHDLCYQYAQAAVRVYNGGKYNGPSVEVEELSGAELGAEFDAEADADLPQATSQAAPTPTPNPRPDREADAEVPTPTPTPNPRPDREDIDPNQEARRNKDQRIEDRAKSNEEQLKQEAQEKERQQLEAFLKGTAEHNALALENLAKSGAMSFAEFQARKRALGKEVHSILKSWDRQVELGNGITYKDALKSEQAELKRLLAEARTTGNKLRSPAIKARNIVRTTVLGETSTQGGVARSVVGPSNDQVQKGMKAIAQDADALVRVGTLGKALYAGLIMMQIGIAAESDNRAKEFETVLPDNLTKTVGGIALGIAATAIIVPLLPVGAIGAALAGVAIGVAADEITAGIFVIVKKELEEEDTSRSRKK